jgi:hypothetical protein
MADQHADLKQAFAGLLADHTPSSAQTESARLSLRTAIAAEEASTRRGRHRWIVRVAAATALLVAVSMAVVTLSRTPIAADVYLVEVAEATRVLPADELPEGFYLYTDSNSLVTRFEEAEVGGEFVLLEFLAPRRTQTWEQDEYRLLRETVGTPVFFDPEIEAAYYQAGLDAADRVGETFDTAFEGHLDKADPNDWSTDPDELLSQLMLGAERSQAPEPLDVRIIGEAEDIMEPGVLAPPDLRAAIIEVIATLDVETTKAPNGDVVAAITYGDPFYGTVERTWTFDASGYLVRIQYRTLTGFEDGGVPPDTLFVDIEWSRPAFVPEAGVEPGA